MEKEEAQKRIRKNLFEIMDIIQAVEPSAVSVSAYYDSEDGFISVFSLTGDDCDNMETKFEMNEWAERVDE